MRKIVGLMIIVAVVVHIAFELLGAVALTLLAGNPSPPPQITYQPIFEMQAQSWCKGGNESCRLEHFRSASDSVVMYAPPPDCLKDPTLGIFELPAGTVMILYYPDRISVYQGPVSVGACTYTVLTSQVYFSANGYRLLAR